jgi:hypothetical protein
MNEEAIIIVEAGEHMNVKHAPLLIEGRPSY